jgi:hypothetical protein
MKIERYHVRDTFAFFRHCAEERFEHPWLILSETCANCGAAVLLLANRQVKAERLLPPRCKAG